MNPSVGVLSFCLCLPVVYAVGKSNCVCLFVRRKAPKQRLNRFPYNVVVIGSAALAEVCNLQVFFFFLFFLTRQPPLLAANKCYCALCLVTEHVQTNWFLFSIFQQYFVHFILFHPFLHIHYSFFLQYSSFLLPFYSFVLAIVNGAAFESQ